ncbi:MAG TPA: SH3 domain-containing protein [Kofleriaceae bacterium]|nr:SH3 domain-containing protein [Kofleriaceae bacterium]
MRVRTLSLSIIMTAIAAGGIAHADDETGHSVWTRKDTRLRSRPGETAPVVVRADQGEELTVMGSQGRWLRVRFGKRIGWVTRSQVEDRGRLEPRKRAGRSGFSGKKREDALRVKVAIDRVRGFDDPRTKANCTLDLEQGDIATVIGRGHEGWILVQPESGGVGWIPEAAVTDAGAFKGDPRRTPAERARAGEAAVAMAPPAAADDADGADEDDVRIEVASVDEVDDGAAAAAARPATGRSLTSRRVRGGMVAGAGFQAFAMRQINSDTGEALATASGPAAAISAGGQYRIMGDLWIGAAADAELGSASLVYYTANETSPTMATQGVAVDARAEVAWGPRWQLAARAGYHFGTLAVESDRAEPMLIGEQVGGLTVGVGGAMPIGRRLAVAAAVDVMPAGVQRPAELPAGIMYATGMQAAWARASVNLQLPRRMVGAIAYRGGVAKFELTNGAATPTTASRTDQSHTLTAGLGLAF